MKYLNFKVLRDQLAFETCLSEMSTSFTQMMARGQFSRNVRATLSQHVTLKKVLRSGSVKSSLTVVTYEIVALVAIEQCKS